MTASHQHDTPTGRKKFQATDNLCHAGLLRLGSKQGPGLHFANAKEAKPSAIPGKAAACTSGPMQLERCVHLSPPRPGISSAPGRAFAARRTSDLHPDS